MAYVEQYYTTWNDSEGKEHQIKLLQDGGSSGTTAFEIQNSVPYEYFFSGTKESQVKDQVFGREILFNFIVTSSQISIINSMVESNYKEWKIEHYINSTLDGVFWLQPDNFSRNYIKKGDYYEILLSGVDGLGNIKNIEYTNASDGSQYEDRVSIMETIKRVLAHVGIELDFRVQLGTWCTNDSLMTSSECAFDKADSDSRRFAKEKDGRRINTNCYEVISELLEPMNCYLMQSEGYYYIINTREDDSYYFPIAWSDLTVSARVSSDLKVVIDTYDYTDLGNSQTIRPLQTVGVTFRDRNIRDNALTNGDFHLPNTDEWIEGSGLEGGLGTSAYGPNYEMGVAVVPSSIPYSEPPNFHSIAQTIAVRGESDQIQVQWKVRCAELIMNSSFVGESYDSRFKVKCQVRKGTASGDILASSAEFILLGTSDSIYRSYINYFDIHEDDDYFIEFLIDKLESIDWDDYASIEVRFDDINVVAAYSTGEDITFDSYKKISNADSVFIDFLDIDLKFGDSASDTDIGAFKIDGTRTETWSRFGKTDNQSINKLAGQNIIENFSKYKEYLHLSIFDETDSISPHSILQIGSKKFQQVNQSVSYAVKLQKLIDVELVEILNDTVNITVVDFGLSSVDESPDPSSPPDGSVSNPTTNPSQPALVGSLQQVTDVGNLTTNNIGITSGNNSYFSGGGNLGIGTTTPDTLLHINSAAEISTTLITLESDIDNNGEYNEILFKVVGGLNYGAIRSYVLASGRSGLRFATTNDSGTSLNEAISIDGDGNVGIGTDSPSYLLHVYKNTADAHLARFEGATPDYVDIFDYGIEINRSTAIIRNTLNGGSLIIGTNDGSNRTRISINGGSDEIQFHTTGGQAMFSMDTASSDPRFVFKDSVGGVSTMLYEDVTNLGGSRGSLAIDGGATGGYEGYSIGGRAAFIHNNSGVTGIYDDVNDQWIFKATHGSISEMYNDGIAKIQAVSSGANIIGLLQLTQADASGSPPILISQNDVSEEMMEFSTTIGTGNAIEVVGVKSLTTTHFIKVTLPGSLTRYIPCGTII